VALKDKEVRLTASGADSSLGQFDLSASLSLADSSYSARATLAGIVLRRVDRTLPDFRVDVQADVAGRGLDSVAGTMRGAVPDLGIDSLFAAGRLVRGRAIVDQFAASGPVGTLAGSGSWTKSRLAVDCRMETLDLALLHRVSNVQASGRVSGKLIASGTVDSVDAWGVVRCRRLEMPGVTVDGGSGQFKVAFGRALHGMLSLATGPVKAGGVTTESVRLSFADSTFVVSIGSGKTAVTMNGTTAIERAAFSLVVESLLVRTPRETVAVARPLELRLANDSVHVLGSAAGVAGGDIRCDVVSVRGKLVQAAATVQNVDMERLAELLHVRTDASGVLDLELAGRDTFAVSVAATDLVVPSMDIRLRKVEAVLRADRSHAEVDHVWLVHIDSAGTVDTSVVTGVLEYGVEGRFVLGSPTLHAQLRNPGNWVLFFLKPSLLMKSGQVFGDVTLTGNLAVPYMEGRVRIAQARLVVPPLNTAFERVNAEMVFDGGRINIEKLTGRSTRGTVLVTGFVDLGRDWRVDSLRFSSDFTGTTFNPQPEVYAVAGGSVAVDWAPGRPVSVTGTADVQEALLTYGFGQSAGSGGFDTSYVFDVRARAERGVWLRNDLVDIEFSGDLAVRKTLTDMTYSGSLDLRQGTVYYLDHTLRVTSATALFQNINTVNPDINITAEMPVRAAGTGEGTALPDKIVLSVTGTLEQPAISFQSEPPGWTELEIASYLSLNVTPGQLSVLEQKNAVSRLLSERVLGYFQTQVSKRARGLINLDYLSFESGFVGGQGTKVTVGKYVGRNLYVSYTQNFTGEMQPAFQVEYYINRRNELVAERSEDGRYSVRYRLKLRY
jgi:autotransporter translocation and assembly factor TamB